MSVEGPVCPICHSPSGYWREKDGFTIVRCTSRECRHGFVHPMPTLEELEAFYATATDTLENSGSWTMAEDYERNPKVAHKFYERARIRQLRRCGLVENLDTRILDVGCSTGVFLKVLADRGYSNLCGQELSLEQAEYCRRKLGLHVVRSLEELGAGGVDLVSAYAVLEHVRDVTEFIAHISRVLRRGGHLVIDVPNTSSWYQAIARENWLWLIPPAHLHYFTPQSLSLLLIQAGFEPLEKKTVSTSTYLYIILHHLSKMSGKSIPGTSVSSSWTRRNLIWFVEKMLRVMFFPLAYVAQRSMRHNQLVFVATKM